MNIARDAVVSFEYVLTDEAGAMIDEGKGDDAMVYLHGHGQIVPGLEAALEGKAKGDTLKVVVPAKDGYGEPEDDDVLRVPKSEIPHSEELEIGMELEAEGPDGAQTFWVIDVEDDDVLLTTDHPLAGITLCFDVTVGEVRAATADELEHGHAHNPGSHHHH